MKLKIYFSSLFLIVFFIPSSYGSIITSVEEYFLSGQTSGNGTKPNDVSLSSNFGSILSMTNSSSFTAFTTILPTTLGTLIFTEDNTTTLTSATGGAEETVANYEDSPTAGGPEKDGTRSTTHEMQAMAARNNIASVTGSCGKVWTITVDETDVVINSQSTAAQTRCINVAFTPITVTATGATGYQWYSNTIASTTGGTSLGSPNGAQTSSYTPQSTAAGTLFYYCIVSGTSGSPVNSAVSGAFITNANVAINSQTTASQNRCINEAFSPITVAATGFGLTYQWYCQTVNVPYNGLSLGSNNGAQTNSYTPQSSATGTLFYYCVVSGTCGSSVTSNTITMTVNTNNTVSLTSAAESNHQNICLGASIGTIRYRFDLNAGTTGATLSGLPTSIVGTYNNNEGYFTINGTINQAGTFPYTVTSQGGCGQAIASGTITVNAATIPGTISGAATVCSGSNSTTLQLNDNNGNVIRWQSSPVANFASGVVTITNTTTTLTVSNLTATRYYRATVKNGGCNQVNSPAVIIIVNPNLPASVSVAASATTICQGTSVTFTATPTNGGTTPTYQWKINGINVSGQTASIFTSTTLANGNIVTVAMTSNASPCLTDSPTTSNGITMTVNSNLPASVSVMASATTICAGTNVTFIATPINGGTTPSYQWKLNGTNVGTNSATYTTTALVNENTVAVVMTSNASPCLTGSLATSNTVSMIVNPENTVSLISVAGTNAQTVCINTSITNITYATTGATGANVIGLPEGVAATWANNTITISGTPSESGLFNYTAILTGGCGTTSATGTITITPNMTISLDTFNGDYNQTLCIGDWLEAIELQATGATGAYFEGLPAGLYGYFNSSTAVIAGIVAESGIFNYTVTLTGGCGIVTAMGTITIYENTAILSSAPGTNLQTVCSNIAMVPITYSTTGATGAYFVGLPPGVVGTWADNIATISGTPTEIGTFNYIVYFGGGCGNLNRTGTIIITQNNSFVLSLTEGTNEQVNCVNVAITLIKYASTGGAGASFVGLPPGVTGSWSANTVTISGIPTQSGTFNYTVTIAGGCTPATASGTITVISPTVDPLTGGIVTGGTTICSFTDSTTLLVAENTGSIVKWQSSTTSDFSANVTDIINTTTTLVATNLTETTYYRAVVQNSPCSTTNSSVAAITFKTTTWNGTSWSLGVPDATTKAIFAASYNSAGNGLGDLQACSLQVLSGAIVTVNPGDSFTILNEVKVDAAPLPAALIMENTSNLIQVNNVANTDYVYYRRTTTPVRKYDYTYWSSPVSNQLLSTFSPNSAYYYLWNNVAPTTYNWSFVAPSTTMAIAKGYIIRTPDIAPYNTATANTWSGEFFGAPNNGTITTPIVLSGANDLNLIGNPYPSVLDADSFLTFNKLSNGGVVGGTLFFWTHNTPITAYNYSGNDYASYNLTGGIGTRAALSSPCGGCNNAIPNGKIGAGQSFFILAAGSGNATFTNAMRFGVNNQFFKFNSGSSSIEKNRLWIDISNSGGLYKQLLVGFIEGATNAYDMEFDGNSVDAGNAIMMYSILGDKKLGIQGRALPFDVHEEIPLGYKSTVAADFEIKLSDYDGLFLNQDVYLEDTLLNVIYNLKSGNYSFATAIGTFDTRFKLIFRSTTLNNPDINASSFIVYNNNNQITVNSGTTEIKEITVYDIEGRVLAKYNAQNVTDYSFDTPAKNQVLLLKITTSDNKIFFKKILS